MKASKLFIVVAAAVAVLVFATGASADTASTTSGYQVSLSGPATAQVGVPTTYSATCGGGYACPYGEFRAFGSILNRLGEGFGTGALRAYTFRAPGTYQIRYRVGASCPGSPRLACPIDVWLYTVVTA